MGIESNKEAYQTMKNSIGSMENRMREIYNKGYSFLSDELIRL